MYENKEKNLNKKQKRKRLLTIIIVIAIITISVATAMNYSVIITWIIPSSIPSVHLTEPIDNATETNPIFFNWTVFDGDGDTPQNVWYADTSQTFISPYRITVNTGTQTNHTHTLTNGTWFWKVEVSDNDGSNTSEVWRVYVGDTANYPSLSNHSVSPDTGTTCQPFYYNITYTDPNNVSATYVRVYIDDAIHTMTETDPLDTNTSDGKNYTYNTMLSLGSHNYTYTCYNGIAINTTALFIGPTATPNILPTIANPFPANESTSITYTNNSIDVADDSGGLMTITFYSNSSGVWLPFNSTTSTNGTVTMSNANFSSDNTTYWWNVSVSDACDTNNSAIFHFTTKENQCPIVIPHPSNGTTNASRLQRCNVTITDLEGDLFNYSIETSWGQSKSENLVSSGTFYLDNFTLQYSTNYTWYVNVSSPLGCQENLTLWFTTRGGQPTISVLHPLANAINICPCSNYVSFDVDYDTNVNITVYAREQGDSDWNIWKTYQTIPSTDYAFCMDSLISTCPPYLQCSSNESQQVSAIDTWINCVPTAHDYHKFTLDIPNQTVIVQESGRYSIEYWKAVQDTSSNPTGHSMAMAIFKNDAIINGSYREIDFSKQSNERHLTGIINTMLSVNDQLQFKFIGDSTNQYVVTHGTWTDNNISAYISIAKTCVSEGHALQFDTSYEWYIYAESCENTSLSTSSPTFTFTTTDDPASCTTGGGISGGSNTWIVGLIIIFTSLPIGIMVRNNKKQNRRKY